MTKRRRALGTQPPVSATEPAKQVAGVIEPKPDPIAVDEKALAADRELSIVVQLDDDWLERLDLPLD